MLSSLWEIYRCRFFLKGNVQQMTVCREEEIVIKADHFLRNYCSVTFNNCFFEQTAFCGVLILFLIKYWSGTAGQITLSGWRDLILVMLNHLYCSIWLLVSKGESMRLGTLSVWIQVTLTSSKTKVETWIFFCVCTLLRKEGRGCTKETKSVKHWKIRCTLHQDSPAPSCISVLR